MVINSDDVVVTEHISGSGAIKKYIIDPSADEAGEKAED